MQTIAAPSTRSRRKTKSPKTFSRSRAKARTSTTRPRTTSNTLNKGRYVTIYLSHTLATRYEDQAALFKTTVGKLIKEVGNLGKMVVIYRPLPKIRETLKRSGLFAFIKQTPEVVGTK